MAINIAEIDHFQKMGKQPILSIFKCGLKKIASTEILKTLET